MSRLLSLVTTASGMTAANAMLYAHTTLFLGASTLDFHTIVMTVSQLVWAMSGTDLVDWLTACDSDARVW